MVHFIDSTSSRFRVSSESQIAPFSTEKFGSKFGFARSKLGPANIVYKTKAVKLDLSQALFSEIDLERGVVLPKKITPALAEEIGMHLGDGFLSLRKNEYRLKGSHLDEREFYDGFVKSLYKKLFNLEVQMKDFGTSYGFEICSKALWTFKSRVLGISPGRKSGIRVPEILKVSDPAIIAGFLRGYFDTDGCLSFISKYGHASYYPIISAASQSEFMIRDVAEILKMLGLRPTVYRNRGWWELQMRGYGNFFRFSELIGWNSIKYVDKINAWLSRYPQLSHGASGEVVSHGPVVLKSTESPEAEFDSRLAPYTVDYSTP